MCGINAWLPTLSLRRGGGRRSRVIDHCLGLPYCPVGVSGLETNLYFRTMDRSGGGLCDSWFCRGTCLVEAERHVLSYNR